VQGGADVETVLADARVGALLIGPGSGRAEAGRALLHRALASGRPLVLDADALMLLGEEELSLLHQARTPPILTPHAGEFTRLFGGSERGKVEAARTRHRQPALW
jgi:NAD(P)H-hydrate repair Nnr-like enzyme with NAD(P)H-hydrate dehydratase domain